MKPSHAKHNDLPICNNQFNRFIFLQLLLVNMQDSFIAVVNERISGDWQIQSDDFQVVQFGNESRKNPLNRHLGNWLLLERSRCLPSVCNEKLIHLRWGHRLCVHVQGGCVLRACRYPVNRSSCCLDGGARFFPPHMGQLCTNQEGRKSVNKRLQRKSFF